MLFALGHPSIFDTQTKTWVYGGFDVLIRMIGTIYLLKLRELPYMRGQGRMSWCLYRLVSTVLTYRLTIVSATARDGVDNANSRHDKHLVGLPSLIRLAMLLHF